VRGEQVALDAVGEELEHLARRALLLAREALGIHAGRRARSTGQTSTTTPALERAEPRRSCQARPGAAA
jgi:hypothetical protein